MFITQTDSTNDFLRQMLVESDLSEFFVVQTDFQNAGRGQRGNIWQSECGKNLLFSVLLKPKHINATEQFIVSQMAALAVKNTLAEFADGFTVKWANDIYWRDKKIGGILIENDLNGSEIKHSIIGIGLNINQIHFSDTLPNPVSLSNITGKVFDKEKILERIFENFKNLYFSTNFDEIRTLYFNNLYRKNGFFPYQSGDEKFLAKITAIKNDGKIVLTKTSGDEKEFYFKELKFVK
ncbi:MAG: biotin--[acetyl-CoA-carboxylase] ligase [Paludibacter sp.]|nr:biotin--[acetyl-CoA-carboxylase] ligase [Paludibacter sp.]